MNAYPPITAALGIAILMLASRRGQSGNNRRELIDDMAVSAGYGIGAYFLLLTIGYFLPLFPTEAIQPAAAPPSASSSGTGGLDTSTQLTAFGMTLAAVGTVMAALLFIAWQATRDAVNDSRNVRDQLRAEFDILRLVRSQRLDSIRHQALVDAHIEFADADSPADNSKRIANREILQLIRCDDPNYLVTWLNKLENAREMHAYTSLSAKRYIDTLPDRHPGNTEIVDAVRSVKRAIKW